LTPKTGILALDVKKDLFKAKEIWDHSGIWE
jgi:hypothetical protein